MELGLICVTVEIDIVFTEDIAKAKKVNDRQQSSSITAFW